MFNYKVRVITIFILLNFILPVCLVAQSSANPDGIDTGIRPIEQTFSNNYKSVLDSNFLLNIKGTPQALNIIPHKSASSQLYFYLLALLFLVLGITRSFYSRYFSTLFRVFFNTSLRQNQLTDQLEQAKLPSLIFNIFFVVTTGVYIYFLLKFFYPKNTAEQWYIIFLSIGAVAICYFVKYTSLKFSGWVTNHQSEADTYIFIIFLLNKVIGIFLLPIITLMAFSAYQIAYYAVLFSFIFIALLFLLRFFRSYSLLQNKLRISKFHFLLYIVSIEILPILLIYKVVSSYFGIKA
jgi:Domain of unknown function (DUF4271)